VWLRVGNCTTTEIEQLLRKHAPVIAQFIAGLEGVILELG
jgi:predicted nuclease of predicted toxin-antitoxin system